MASLDAELYTTHKYLRDRVLLTDPDIKLAFLQKEPSHSTGMVNILSKMSEWMGSRPKQKPTQLRQYSNVIDEANAIIRHKSKLTVATNSESLRLTLQAIATKRPQSDPCLLQSLWLKSAEAIFLLNRIKAIDYCCNHPLVVSKLKSNLFYKNHVVRNEIISTFTDHTKSLNRNEEHSFRHLADLHYSFIQSISIIEVENLLSNVRHDPDITVYEYIGLIAEILEDKLDKSNPADEDKFEVVRLHEVPWLDSETPIWLGGLSHESDMDENYLSPNIMYFSYSAFQNSCTTYPHPAFVEAEVIDLRQQYKQLVYNYEPPAPKLHVRKNSFAINHVTKLLNNPYNFYVESILKLKSHNFHPNHIVGILVHSVFEELIKQTPSFENFEQVREEMNILLSKNHFSTMDYIVVLRKVELMLKYLCNIVATATTLYPEHEGMQKIIHNSKEYCLHGRADLIYEKDSRHGIIDFKTGKPPSWINIVNGSAPQISVAILMLRYGGFLQREIKQIADSGFISPQGIFKVDGDDFILQSAVEGIKDLINVFWEQETPYYLHITEINTPYRLLARNCNAAN